MVTCGSPLLLRCSTYKLQQVAQPLTLSMPLMLALTWQLCTCALLVITKVRTRMCCVQCVIGSSCSACLNCTLIIMFDASDSGMLHLEPVAHLHVICCTLIASVPLMLAPCFVADALLFCLNCTRNTMFELLHAAMRCTFSCWKFIWQVPLALAQPKAVPRLQARLHVASSTAPL